MKHTRLLWLMALAFAFCLSPFAFSQAIRPFSGKWQDLTGRPDLGIYLTSTAAATIYLPSTTAASIYLPSTSAAALYQPLDADLTTLATMPSTTATALRDAAPFGVGLLSSTSAASLRTRGGSTWLVKTSDETVNNSITLQDDDTFRWDIGANEIWTAKIYLIYTSVTPTPKLRFDFTGPSSPTLVCYHGEAMGSFSVNAGGRATAFSTTRSFAGATSSVDVFIVHFVVVNGANAGTVQFRWAQQVATAENTRVSAGSYAELRQVSP